MKGLDFLKENNENILEASVCEVVTNDGLTSGISMTIGMTDDMITELIEHIGVNGINRVTSAFEVVLTKEELLKLNVLMGI